MKKKFGLKILIFSVIVLIFGVYSLINLTVQDDKFHNIKSLLSNDTKKVLKKYLFPYKLIDRHEELIAKQKKILDTVEPYLINLELDKKESGTDIGIKKSIMKLSNNKTLMKYKLTSGFHLGIMNLTPGSGYIDFYENNIFAISARGVLAFAKNLNDDSENFKQIQNNIGEFINANQFKKNRKFSIRDLSIFDEKIYVSFIDEHEPNCWNTSIIYGNINYTNIKFKKLFSPKECIHSKLNVDGEFTPSQSGGRIVKFDNNHILFSLGEYRSRFLAQDKESVNGKIIRINLDNSDYEIISMGHRNPQGLYFDKENNFILESEHGPKGGDEINLIEVEKINKNNIQNYGWATVSTGKFYGANMEKYILSDSHSEYGFIEPLKEFTPAIAPSEIVKIDTNKYVLSSMRDKSLYFFELNSLRKIINLERVEVSERIRDMKFKENKLYLFMEDSASIGVINLL